MLSGCSTGLAGLSRAAEEFVGLPAGWLEAGAGAVLASHWPVRDDVAFLLSERFYDELNLAPDPATGAEQVPPAAALKRAVATS